MQQLTRRKQQKTTLLSPSLKAALLFTCSLILPFYSPGIEAKEVVNFSLLVINGEQREAYLKQVQDFEKEHPDIEVNILAVPSEQYKAEIENWLNDEYHSDVMFWFAGERLNWYIQKNLVQALDTLDPSLPWRDTMTNSAMSSVSRHDKVYGLPVHYYHWGIYYKKSLFYRLNIEPPQNWDDFIRACESLKREGIRPIVLATEETWPVAGWFDYLNLRLNGLAFHQELMAGKRSYLSEEVTRVFDHWKEMNNAGFFLENHQELTWRDSLPYLYHERAGMMLMGNFWTSQIPGSMKNDISVFRFPRIDETIPYYEEAPTDVLFIPQNARNKRAAMKFIAFMARPAVQQALNAELGMLPPQTVKPLAPDHFIAGGSRILQAAAGASQYYDRDNPQPIATAGMKEMVNFLESPKQTRTIQIRLEMLRKESFGKQ